MKKYSLFLFILLVSYSCSKNKDQQVIKSYLAAHNDHNIQQELSFYDENIEFELKGVWTKSGLSEMRSLADWDVALNSNLSLKSIQSSADSLFCTIVENNDWFRAVGINDLVHDPVVFVVENEKIVKIIAYPSVETGQEVEAAVGRLFQWSQQNQDSTINKLIQNGQFIYSTEAAEMWLDLFERMKSSDSIQ